MARQSDSLARRLQGEGVVREQVATEARPRILRSVSGGVLVSAVAEHHRNWRRKRRASGRDALADDALRGFGKSRKN